MNWTNLFTGGRVMHDKRSRNRYPKALIEMLSSRFAFAPGMVGADIGAGSGRLSALFLEHGYSVTAVEGNHEKRDKCEQLRGRWPSLTVRNGTPEATGLATSSVDFVTAPRALYWPDQAAVGAEFRRILRPGGTAVLITDNRVYSGAAQSEAYEDVLRTNCLRFREKRMPYDLTGAVEAFFGRNEFYEDAFMGHQTLTYEALVQQTKALPICPRETDPQYQPLLRALRTFFDQWAKDGAILVPTVCRVACGRLDL
ncbi:Methyltransferase domain-containing protein [Granulicella rosea]|uniref:Methyltransferase domain-containing protein n=1 Tax=Granulicella rosea TaxID=474952 RepID=A0A239MBD9_9BACT|nr:class I SAM-dependent methyltransferase [Granulicella rosea]SNT40085.1 Methyltransferase domain-containing protein [Granulicella rosea]